MGYKFPYKQLNEAGPENKFFLFESLKKREKPDLFEKKLEYQILCDQYLKKKNNDEYVTFNQFLIIEDYRETYDILFTFFINKILRELIDSLDPKHIQSTYYNLEAIKLENKKRALDVDVIRWYACYVLSSEFARGQLTFEKVYIHFWKEYINFIKGSSIVSEKESHELIERANQWQIALALRQLMELMIYITSNPQNVYRWFEYNFIKNGKIITAKKLTKAYSNKTSGSNKGKNVEQILDEERTIIDNLIKFFKKRLK